MLGATPSTASPHDSTLIIIDAQNEYAEGQLQVTNAPASRRVIASLLEKYRGGGGRVVHVVHKVPAGAPIFTPDTKLAKEFEELQAKSGEKVIEKQHPSAFADTGLHEYLGGNGEAKLVLTGYMVSLRLRILAPQELTFANRRTSACRRPPAMQHAWATRCWWWKTAVAIATSRVHRGRR